MDVSRHLRVTMCKTELLVLLNTCFTYNLLQLSWWQYHLSSCSALKPRSSPRLYTLSHCTYPICWTVKLAFNRSQIYPVPSPPLQPHCSRSPSALAWMTVRASSLVSLLIVYTTHNSEKILLICQFHAQSSLTPQVTVSQLQHPLITWASVPFLRYTRLTCAGIIWGSYIFKKAIDTQLTWS